MRGCVPLALSLWYGDSVCFFLPWIPGAGVSQPITFVLGREREEEAVHSIMPINAGLLFP